MVSVTRTAHAINFSGICAGCYDHLYEPFDPQCVNGVNTLQSIEMLSS